jgi:methionyl-tRNA formyltransferase
VAQKRFKTKMKKILLLTDNEELLNRFKTLLQILKIDNKYNFIFEYAFSPNNKAFTEKFKGVDWIRQLKVKDEIDFLLDEYDMIFSLHCKQIFPAKLVNNIRCINIHPGLNPYNRGWFPQVFSIINSLPSGATIHEMDEHLDHGAIICQKEVTIEMWDTSLTSYNKILDAEIDLLSDNLENIINQEYKTFIKEEGNLNLKKDFDILCEIDLNDKDTFKNHINKLRALTHGEYTNSYFIDNLGNKVYLKLELKKAR